MRARHRARGASTVTPQVGPWPYSPQDEA